MGLYKKKTDPISERAQALNDEIAALEAQIKRLAQQEQNPGSAPSSSGSSPRLRSTALPHGASAPVHAQPASPPPPVAPTAPVAPKEPIFEEVNQKRLQAKADPSTPEHYNELGVRKYDFAALVQRIKNHFRGPSTANPKLVNYLAAGSIQGLRPMRYEKRVARNRFLLIVIILLVLLVGIFSIIRGGHH